MKSARHEKIIELIQEYDIDTQEELAARLNEAGFKVTLGYSLQRYPGTEAYESCRKGWKIPLRDSYRTVCGTGRQIHKDSPGYTDIT